MTGAGAGVNVVRVRRLVAARAAGSARSGLAGYGAGPFNGALVVLEGAWVSPSPTRARCGEDLVGVGQAVVGVFAAQGTQFTDEAGDEPVQVDPQDPVQGWKADADLVGRRVAFRAQNPYWGR